MASATYVKILEEAKLLSTAELRQLVEELTERSDIEDADGQPPPRWEDLRGAAPYPLCGEDAQEWVSRTRRESDEDRMIQRTWRSPSKIDPSR